MTQTACSLHGSNYELDLETQELVYLKDKDTGERDVIPLSEVVEALAWLMRHGDTIRAMTYTFSPVNFRRPMHLVNDCYYVGTTEDRRLVKISAEVWQRTMQEQERIIRANWLRGKREAKEGVVEIVTMDNSGNPIKDPRFPGLLDGLKEELTSSDCPDWLIQEKMYPLRQVEYWVDRPENLDLGKYQRWY